MTNCSITISRVGPDKIFFSIGNPISMQAQVTLENDSMFSNTTQVGQYLFSASGVKKGNVITGAAKKLII